MSRTPPRLPLDLLPERFAVARLDADAPLPAWATTSRALSAVVRTPTELSILTTEDEVPAEARAERGYRAFRVRGPLPFDLVGIFASMAQPLAEAALAIFALSTYDTDYVLVKEADLDQARAVLEAAGHSISEAP
jgi:uncharacterized protein